MAGMLQTGQPKVETENKHGIVACIAISKFSAHGAAVFEDGRKTDARKAAQGNGKPYLEDYRRFARNEKLRSRIGCSKGA